MKPVITCRLATAAYSPCVFNFLSCMFCHYLIYCCLQKNDTALMNDLNDTITDKAGCHCLFARWCRLKKKRKCNKISIQSKKQTHTKKELKFT